MAKSSVDFSFSEESSTDIPDVEEELAAIFNLDFERAHQLSRRRYNYNDTEAIEEQLHYEEQAQLLEQQNFDNYNEEINLISKDYLKAAENYKTVWQHYCMELVEKQREEADQLEKKWRITRKKELNRNCLKAESSLSTARLLALCEQYDEAIDIRNSAQGDNMPLQKSPELKQIDREFAKRYKIMTKRHFSEFQQLHKHLCTLLKTLREKASALKKNAEANLQVENARNATLIIQTIAKDAISPLAKEKVISSFSPRSKKGSSVSNQSVSFDISSIVTLSTH